jgi:hypothetical protein
MTRSMKSILVIIFLSVQAVSFAQPANTIKLIRPTGDSVGDLPVMSLMPDSTAIVKLVDSAVRYTFVGEMVNLYHLAQQYLFNRGLAERIEPAYLAVTKNQGGFARRGFWLQGPGGEVMDKSRIHYVDLTERSVTDPFDRISSFTQLYPHELMHSIFKMLSDSIETEPVSFNVNMHYFSVITDFNTAFNEGFAEHMENVSVFFEPSEEIRKGKKLNLDAMEPRLKRDIRGFKRDYLWPCRLGYYKSTMLVWYQKFEDFKRNKYTVDGRAARAASYPELKNPRDMIAVRNAGIEQDPGEYLNQVQRMASEGFVSSFFTRLALSELPHLYRPAGFYKSFLQDTMQVINPEYEFSPLWNLFMKYFHVLYLYVDYDKSASAQMIDFIEGYIMEFPDEEPVIRSVYRELAGSEYTSELPLPLWMMVKDYDHPVLVIDPYGAITIPVYTFDANIAGFPDLMTLPGMDRNNAFKILEYRNKYGLFTSWEAMYGTPGLDPGVADIIKDHRIDEDYFKSLPQENLSISALIIKPVLKLFQHGMFAFILVLLLMILLFYKKNNSLQIILKVFIYLGIWILFLLAGLVTVVISLNPSIIFALFVLLYLCILAIIFRRKWRFLVRHIALTALMTGIILYSLQ